MSHVTQKEADTAEQQIKDIPALRRAVARFEGATFVEGQTCFKAYSSEADRVKGVRHAITLADAEYSIGIAESKKFPGTFNLAFDTYSGELEPVFGKGLEKLSMFYHAEALRSVALRNGDQYMERMEADGTIIAEMDTTIRVGV